MLYFKLYCTILCYTISYYTMLCYTILPLRISGNVCWMTLLFLIESDSYARGLSKESNSSAIKDIPSAGSTFSRTRYCKRTRGEPERKKCFRGMIEHIIWTWQVALVLCGGTEPFRAVMAHFCLRLAVQTLIIRLFWFYFLILADLSLTELFYPGQACSGSRECLYLLSCYSRFHVIL